MSIERQAVSGLKWTAASKIVVQAISWAVTLVVLRLLTPADYGLMAMIAVVTTVAATVAELGLGASIIQSRSLPAPELAKVAGLIILSNLSIGVIIAVGAPLFALAFGVPRLTPLLQVTSIQFGLIAASAVPQALMARSLLFKPAAWIEFGSGLTTSIATLAMAFGHFGVWSIVLGNLVGAAARATLLIAFGENVRPDFRLAGIRTHLQFGSMVTATRMSWDLILQSDIMIAARLLSTTAVGAYSVGLHLATLPLNKIMSVLNQVAFPTVARLQDDRERLGQGLLNAFHLGTLITVPLLWGLSSCAPEIVRTVLGPAWEAAILPVQVMSVVIPLRLISGLMSTAATAIGRADLFMKNMLVGAVIFPASFLIGAQWGLNGLALAWPAAWLLNFAATFHRIAGAIGVSFRQVARVAMKPVLAGLPMVGAIHLARELTAALSDAMRLPVLVAAGALTYVAAISVLKPTIWREMRQGFAGAQ